MNAKNQALQETMLLARFNTIRAATLTIAAPLSAEDMVVQSMPETSPIKWHLAHTSWFFETFVLLEFVPAYQAFSPHFKVLFNSYYLCLGDRHPRPQRGMITRPSVSDILAYRNHVDKAIQQLLKEQLPPEIQNLIALGLQHEQQHQELMLTDLKHLLSLNPLSPAYLSTPFPAAISLAPLEWISYKATTSYVGHEGTSFCFDNETPRHLSHIPAFSLANRLATNGEYLTFIQSGAYAEPQWWLSEGVEWINRENAHHPLYWRYQDGEWFEFTLHGLIPLQINNPVCHLNYFEADAFARFSGARLPTEFEWEHAARTHSLSTGSSQGSPDPCEENNPTPLWHLYGQVWQWTCSAYAAYPGFKPCSGAVGEYNGKFMVNQYVLRGSSIATSADHVRISYRNFFPTHARWQFTGLRLAKSST